MTAYEIINTAFGLVGEKLDDYPDKSLPMVWLNVTIAEAAAAENQLRRKAGLKQMTEYQTIDSLSTEVNMQQLVCSICLPFGVAAYLAAERENDYMAAAMRNRFVESLQDAAKGEEKGIIDYYGGGAV